MGAVLNSIILFNQPSELDNSYAHTNYKVTDDAMIGVILVVTPKSIEPPKFIWQRSMDQVRIALSYQATERHK